MLNRMTALARPQSVRIAWIHQHRGAFAFKFFFATTSLQKVKQKKLSFGREKR